MRVKVLLLTLDSLLYIGGTIYRNRLLHRIFGIDVMIICLHVLCCRCYQLKKLILTTNKLLTLPEGLYFLNLEVNIIIILLIVTGAYQWSISMYSQAYCSSGVLINGVYQCTLRLIVPQGCLSMEYINVLLGLLFLRGAY